MNVHTLAVGLFALVSIALGNAQVAAPRLDESFLQAFKRIETNEVVTGPFGAIPFRQRCYSAKMPADEAVEAVRACLDGRYWGFSTWSRFWMGEISCGWLGKEGGPFAGWSISVYRDCSRPPMHPASDIIVGGQPAKGWVGLTIHSPMGPRPQTWPVDSSNVRLDDGLLKRQIDDAKAYYLSIPNDDLLKGFRQRAGFPAPGNDLTDWYKDDIFHVFGQILSGLSRLYAATGDPACKAKAEVLEREWAKCIEKDGYFCYSRKPNAPHYIFDKMVGGLVDMLIYLYEYGDEGKIEKDLSKITDWAIKNLDRKRPFGGDSNEWYTLSENLYRAYMETEEAKYGDFAKVWEYTDYWNLYAGKQSIFPAKGGIIDIRTSKPGTQAKDLATRQGTQAKDLRLQASLDLRDAYHAYSHVNTLGGAGMAYIVTGEKHYLDTLVNAYDFLQRDECYATGGYGPDESLLKHDEVVHRLQTTPNTFETQCGSWAAFKMSKYLMAYTGQARYGDWIERLMVNGVFATTPMTPDGRVLYYSDYNLYGGRKQYIGWGWSCCTGTRPIAAASLPGLIYFEHGADGLCVNLFVPSHIETWAGGTKLELTQTTRFPEESHVRFEFKPEHPATFSMKLRKPDWLAAPPTAKVNGKPVKLLNGGKGWLEVKRNWRSGDVLDVELPMGFRSVSMNPPMEPRMLEARGLRTAIPASADRQPLTADPRPSSFDLGPFPTAIAYGPTVMCFRSEGGSPAKKIDWKNLSANFVKSPGEALTFHLKGDPSVLVRPFYAFKDGEEYFMYLDPSAPNRIMRQRLQFASGWRIGATFNYCDQVGATCEGDFEGTSVRWIGWAFDDAGKARIEIDGTEVAVVDQWGPGRGLPFDWSYPGLKPGKHHIKLTILPEKNPKSTGTFLNVAGFEYW